MKKQHSSPPGREARSGLSRRELLRRAGLSGTAMLAMPDLGRVLLMSRGPLAQTRTLPAAAFATLHAVCARLIPTDDQGPGATEAHAAEFIDRSLRGVFTVSRADYAQGLAAIDRAARQKFDGPFAALSAPQQDAVLIDLQDTPFFNLVRGHTLQGTFCDPIYGGNANFVGWDLLGYPGVRLSVSVAEQNMSTPAAPQHTSAYDSGMFSKVGVDGD
jgi:gluconate 2-dehydrogenase gamma chain